MHVAGGLSLKCGTACRGIWRYLSNVYFARRRRLARGHVSHLWSLAVEEQFYLLWPVVVLFQPARRMKGILALVIAIGPVLPVPRLMERVGRPSRFSCLPFGAADSLALGALAGCRVAGGRPGRACSL